MISTGRACVPDYWRVAATSGLATVLVTLGFNLLGDGVRDALGQKQR